MPTDYLLGLLFRWLHILAAITAVGGTIFTLFALLPAAAQISDSQRASLMDAVRRRWSKWIMAAIFFLLASGFYNYFANVRIYEKLPSAYHAMFGAKFILALAVFFLASVLTGRSALAARFRENARLWLSVNLILAVAIVCLSGVMRSMREATPRKPAPQVAVASASLPPHALH